MRRYVLQSESSFVFHFNMSAFCCYPIARTALLCVSLSSVVHYRRTGTLNSMQRAADVISVVQFTCGYPRLNSLSRTALFPVEGQCRRNERRPRPAVEVCSRTAPPSCETVWGRLIVHECFRMSQLLPRLRYALS
jgi:hypothetical protein